MSESRGNEISQQFSESLRHSIRGRVRHEDAAREPVAKSDVADELTPCVQALMGRLPEGYKRPLILTELKGLTQKEIGEKLALSVSGARSRVQRGRERPTRLLLHCCHFKFDQLGNIQEYRPSPPDSLECCRDSRRRDFASLLANFRLHLQKV